MLIIRESPRQHIDQTIRAYRRKLEETHQTARLKKKIAFLKPSLKRRRMKTKAIYTQRYKVLHGLV